MSKATVNDLGKLHGLLTKMFLDEIEMYREEGIPMPAADKAAITRFLKDNSITADPADMAELEELQERLRAGREERDTRLARMVGELDAATVEQLYMH